MKKTLMGCFAAAGLLVLAACGSAQKPENEKPAAPAKTAALPADLFSDKAPEGAKDVVAAKQEIKPGEEIVVRGRIGGEQPFTKGRAMMVLFDPALPACNENPDDACEVPWDFCCETKETRIKNSAAVQVLGEDGKVLAVDLEGAHELGPLDLLVVKGKVDDASQAGNLIVNAKTIYVEKRGNRKPATK